MKNLILFTLIFSSFSSFADVSTEAATVSRILLNNPSVVTKLRKANTLGLIDISKKNMRDGVTEFTLTYNRACYCLPAKSVVKVLEDLTPTYSDGPARYESSITTVEGDEIP